jgi:hypothetical protein
LQARRLRDCVEEKKKQHSSARTHHYILGVSRSTSAAAASTAPCRSRLLLTVQKYIRSKASNDAQQRSERQHSCNVHAAVRAALRPLCNAAAAARAAVAARKRRSRGLNLSKKCENASDEAAAEAARRSGVQQPAVATNSQR